MTLMVDCAQGTVLARDSVLALALLELLQSEEQETEAPAEDGG